VGCAAFGLLAQPDPFSAAPEAPRVRMSLIGDHESVAPGQTFALGISFEIDAGWHMYWNGLNDTGYAPRFEITGPAGFEVGEALWPAPVRHVSPGDILDHVYEGRVTLVVPVTAPASLQSGGEVEFRVRADWLVCESVCIPEEGMATVRVRTGEAVASEGATLKMFEAARARIPTPAPESVWDPRAEGAPFRVLVSERSPAMVQISSRGAAGLRFFPGVDCPPITNLLEGGDVRGGRAVLRLESPEDGGRVAGVVEVVGESGSAFYALEGRDGGPDRAAEPGEGDE